MGSWRMMVSKKKPFFGNRPEGGAERSPLGKTSVSPFPSFVVRKFPDMRTSVPSSMRQGCQFSLR